MYGGRTVVVLYTFQMYNKIEQAVVVSKSNHHVTGGLGLIGHPCSRSDRRVSVHVHVHVSTRAEAAFNAESL
jgi:hypothetical protein